MEIQIITNNHPRQLLDWVNLTEKDLAEWDGYSPDTYFSGIVTKLVPEEDSIMVGRYYS